MFKLVSNDIGLPLLREAHKIARSKGWWDGVDAPEQVWASVPEKIALIHSEISEALECAREGQMVTTLREDGKPEGFPSELADVVIRCYDLMGALGEEFYKPWTEPTDSEIKFPSVGAALADLHGEVSDVYTEWWLSAGRPTGVSGGMTSVIMSTEQIANGMGIDLLREVEAKMAYNRTRPSRHGGKLF
jgi:hypothetical protein